METTKGAVCLQLPDSGIYDFEQIVLSLSHQHPNLKCMVEELNC